MRISVSRQIWSWSVVAFVVVLALWGLGNVMTPFLIGAGLAYALDPLADMLERSGLSRTMSVALITLIAVLGFVLALVLIGPMVVRQLAQLVQAVPGYVDTLQRLVSERYPDLLPEGGPLRTATTQVVTQFSERGMALLAAVLGSLGNVFSALTLLVIAPVVAFYLLLDWDRMVVRIDELLPLEHADTIRAIANRINHALAGYLRGQALVTLILATFYSVGLLAAGLSFGLVIGIAAAVLSVIPYLGVLLGGITAVSVAAFQFWDQPQWIFIILAIFLAGQFIEGNYLQPKIVGGHVGLHPVWLMVALAVFGKLFGFVGLIVAVPMGAIIGVLARFFVERYKESSLFTGRQVLPEPAPPTLVEVVPRGTTAKARKRSRVAHDAAVAHERVEEARQQARHAAEDAAHEDHARVAVARYPVLDEGAEGGVERLQADAKVRTWGGSTPDGADPHTGGVLEKVGEVAKKITGRDGDDDPDQDDSRHRDAARPQPPGAAARDA